MSLFDLIFPGRRRKAAAPAAEKDPLRSYFPSGGETGRGAEEMFSSGAGRGRDPRPAAEALRGESGEAFFPGEDRRESPAAAKTSASLDAIAECAAKQVRLLRKMSDLMKSQSDGTYYL